MLTSPSLLKFPHIRHGFADVHDTKDVKNPLTLRQIHSFEIFNPADMVYDKDCPPAGDGWVADKKGYCLTVKTADCVPLLMTDGRVIAAVHAGWKGALLGVVEQAILQMIKLGARVEDIYAATGPCLQTKSFEVQDDMRKLFSENANAFFIEKDGKTYFNLVAYVEYRLHRSGVLNVEVSDIDTYTNMDYMSARQEPENLFRQYSWIEII